MERRLGKGLSSLLGEQETPHEPSELELEAIHPNPFQPRKTMDASGLEELRDSIVQHGVLQPVVVRRLEDGRYQLIAGERRWRASRLAGLRRIPAMIKTQVTDAEMLELALVENVQRRDLDPLERAHGYKTMMEQLALTQDAVAAKVGLKRSTVANHLRLLDLPAKGQEALAKGLITMGHARALLSLSEESRLNSILEETVRRDLSVREVERLVREANVPPTRHSPSDKLPAPPVPVWLRELESRIRARFASKVTIQNGEGYRGKIVIDYFNRTDLDRICELLAPKDLL
ncbi:MAG TPA: ParB/RepB/Spo0J family partition protein [Planctomycetota bacterium]|nr:ParB/RepB/Spo0J family partition protein [Planctomycetota bacterium]